MIKWAQAIDSFMCPKKINDFHGAIEMSQMTYIKINCSNIL